MTESVAPAPARLAIVIPAWKPDFLRQALESLERQTSHDYHVYVGDDASPHHLDRVVEPFLATGRFSYHRFPDNRGGRDLVAQWTRCVELTRDEELVWLFSDDDVCSPECVESVLEAARIHPATDLFHFPVRVIDELGAPLQSDPPCDFASATDFLERRVLDECPSFVVEYVFRRGVYERTGGFERFDLAWGSDDATWIKFSLHAPSILVPGGTVSWRKSAQNISPRVTPDVASRKIAARLAFHRWARNFPVLWTGRLRDPRRLGEWFYGHVRIMVESVGPLSILRWCESFRRDSGFPWSSHLRWLARIYAAQLKRNLAGRLHR